MMLRNSATTGGVTSALWSLLPISFTISLERMKIFLNELKRAIKIDDIIGITISTNLGVNQFVVHIMDVKDWDLRYESPE